MRSDVTVVVPVYNGERHLASCLESLLKQSEKAHRLVCLDDASTDSSPAIAQRFEAAGVTTIRSAERRGLAGSWNAAIDLVDTPFFVLAHQDDLYHPEFLRRQRTFSETLPATFAVHCRAVTIDATGRRRLRADATFKESLWPPRGIASRTAKRELLALGRGNYIVCPSVMYRTGAVRQIGQFDDAYPFATDWEYWIRGSLKGFEIGANPETLMSFRRHEETASEGHRRALSKYEDEIRLLDSLATALESRGMTLRHRYRAAERIILSDFITALGSGQPEAARRLVEMVSHDHRLRGSKTHLLMRWALPLGRPAGKLLTTFKWTAILAHLVQRRATEVRFNLSRRTRPA